MLKENSTNYMYLIYKIRLLLVYVCVYFYNLISRTHHLINISHKFQNGGQIISDNREIMILHNMHLSIIMFLRILINEINNMYLLI